MTLHINSNNVNNPNEYIRIKKYDVINHRFIPIEAANILSQLENYGYKAFIVGGFVRDVLMGKNPELISDVDMATSASPQQVLDIFGDSAKLVEARQAYPVVLVGKSQIQVATFRKDGANRKDADGIDLNATVWDDAMRRDFTINSFYMDRSGNVSCYNRYGFDDLANGVIRFVGNAVERINEDPIRMIRALKFALRFDFVFEPETAEALSNSSINIIN